MSWSVPCGNGNVGCAWEGLRGGPCGPVALEAKQSAGSRMMWRNISGVSVKDCKVLRASRVGPKHVALYNHSLQGSRRGKATSFGSDPRSVTHPLQPAGPLSNHQTFQTLVKLSNEHTAASLPRGRTNECPCRESGQHTVTTVVTVTGLRPADLRPVPGFVLYLLPS